VVGSGIYLVSIWERDLGEESGDRDSQNILIIYIAVIVICYLFYYQVYLVHARQESCDKQDKVLARLQELRKDTMEKTGCSTVFEYRQWLVRKSLRRGSEEGDTDMENIHEPYQPVELSTSTESKRALDVENWPERFIATSHNQPGGPRPGHFDSNFA
jgi:hypothetical protein